jgi:hypothetical protein
MRRKTRRRESIRRRTKLGLPDLEHVKSAVLVSLRSPESQRSYRRSIEDFVCWYCSEPRLSFNLNGFKAPPSLQCASLFCNYQSTLTVRVHLSLSANFSSSAARVIGQL